MRTAKIVFVNNVGNVQVVRQNSPGDIFYDLFAEDGRCLNASRPFWVEPTDDEVRQWLANEPCISRNQTINAVPASA